MSRPNNRKYQPFIINSRSYNNLKTETDHRPREDDNQARLVQDKV